MPSQHKVLFMLTGSIACYKACNLLSQLVQSKIEVQTVVTQDALSFIGKSTLEGLSGKPVLNDIYQPGHQMDHIGLARWADLILICPATANTINKLACGIADDFVSAIALANNFIKPLWIAPAMNTQMYLHPATQKSLKLLKEWGTTVFESPSGNLACGENGEGRLIEPTALYEQIKGALK